MKFKEKIINSKLAFSIMNLYTMSFPHMNPIHGGTDKTYKCQHFVSLSKPLICKNSCINDYCMLEWSTKSFLFSLSAINGNVLEVYLFTVE